MARPRQRGAFGSLDFGLELAWIHLVVLEPRLSWLTFASAQIAVLLGAIGLSTLRTEVLGLAGLAGCIAFLALSGNVLFARGAALRRRALGGAVGL